MATDVAGPRRTRARLRTRSMGPGDWLPLGEGHVLISACRADELAREHSFGQSFIRKVHGVLTYCLLEAMREADGRTTYHDLWATVRVKVLRLSPRQNPQLEGAFERLVFGGAALPRRRYVEVSPDGAGGVTLAAGAVHGATAGSAFAVYPRGTHEFSDPAARVAVVVLTEVDSFHSVAVLRQGDIKTVAVGAPAVEIEHDYSSTRMVVEVGGDDDDVLESVRRLVSASPLLSLSAGDGQSPTAKVVRLEPNMSEGREGARLAVLSSVDNHPLVESIAAEEAGAAAAVVYKLEHVAKYHNVLAIRNLSPRSKLRDRARIHLLKAAGVDAQGRELLVPATRDAGGDLVLKTGERVVLEIENLSDAPFHAALIDCDTQWGVRPIFPPPGAPDDTVPARSRRRTNRFQVNLPRHQQGRTDFRALSCETVKLFATTEPVDFRSIWQPETRHEGRADDAAERSTLYRLMRFAVGGESRYARRSLEDDGDTPVEDWTTDELLFHVTS